MSRKGLLGCFVALALLSALATGASAQAAGTRICENNAGSTCSAVYPVGTLFKGTGSIILNGVTSCTGGTIELENTAIGSGAEPTEILAVTGTSCTGGCSVIQANPTPWSAPVQVGGSGPNGTAKVTATGSPALKVLDCSNGMACEYAAPGPTHTIEESITGGSNAIFKASGPTMEKTAGTAGCPAKAGLSMVHEVGTGTGGFYVRT